ncbi:DUF5985 family protein [Sphingomonas sp. LY29]|uniref:DUF5985 family protein n=2 Tax=unclassified Sphingomonas TaxID=196159 RepID=UPI003A7F1F15
MNDLLPAIVYVLCLLTSMACAFVLVRSFRKNRMPLLFWSGVCFTFLAANNLVLVLDHLVWPDADLRVIRLGFSLLAAVSMLWGAIWCVAKDAE